MDFALDDKTVDLRERLLAFMEKFVYPAEGLAKYSWPETIEVFDEFPRTPSLKVVKHDVVRAIVARPSAASPA